MIKVCDVLTALFDAVPEYMKMEWDNVGLLCGRRTAAVRRVMVALDPMPDVFAEAKARGCELIVTHHPLIFQPVRAVNDASFTGENLLWLIENGIAAINLHTNLDCAPGGVNDILAQTLRLSDVSVLDPLGQDAQGRDYGLIRVGTVAPCALRDFAAHVKAALAYPGVRFADGGKTVHKVAVGGGSCGSELNAVLAAGCDTFVTADLKYNHFEEAKYRGLNLIDAGHFETENPVCTHLADILRAAFPELEVYISRTHRDETQFLTNG